MEVTYISAMSKFGEKIKTTFIDGDGQRVETAYSFSAGPGVTFSRRNDTHHPNEAWDLKFIADAPLQFERETCHFRTATVVHKGASYEMIITVMFRSTPKGERLIFSIKEL
ncbi:hypothetical protein ACT2VT_000158 [Pantoea agglomerans]